MRMFVAAVPPRNVVDDLAAHLDALRQALGQDDEALRWTLPEQWHLTLSFLPAVAPRRLEELIERLGRAARRRESPMLSLAGAVAFPRPARARVLGVGVAEDGETELRRLATGTYAAAARSGAEVDSRRFHPHLTLARLREPGDAIRWMSTFSAYHGPRWSLTEVALVESRLGAGPGGRPQHEQVATFQLGRPVA